MRKMLLRVSFVIAVILGLAVLLPVRSASATPPRQDDKVAHGKYIVSIIGCADCHSPIDDKTGQTIPGKEFSGGRPFDLGPLGIVYTKNITQDKKTGLGDWTDDEIKTAITTGVSKDGLHLFPVMPYLFFNNMSDDDLDAVVAYLRTIKPIENQVERRQVVPPDQLPHLTRKSGITTPDPKDTPARAKYLMTALLTCSDCHTPVDPQTLQPVLEKYLAGGQPFEGPWGIVYGGNITPDQKTGIASWTDEDIRRLIRTGVRPDGRVTVVMPWQIYTNLSDDDLTALIYYLRNDVKPVEGVVPAAKLNEGFEKHVEIAPKQAPTDWTLLGAIGGVVILLGGGIFLVIRQRRSTAK